MLRKANKNGISLIVLVITIIIMIIIAGAVILTLNGSGIITKSSLAKESSDFATIKEAVEIEKQNMLLTGTFDKNKIDIPDIYKDDIEITQTGEMLIKYNPDTKIIDMANAIKILGATYISNGFDEIQSISGGTAFTGETRLAKIIIEGKSEQIQTTQGKNLFDKNKAVQGVGLADKNKGYVYDVTYAYIDYLEVKPNTNYYKSGNTAGGIIVFYGLDKTYLNEISVVNGSFTTPSNAYYIRGNTRTDALNTLQIEEGSTATSYQAFVPNSPSPEYPSPINSVSDFDLISSGKNLFNLSAITPIQTMVKTDTGLKLSGYQCIGNYMWGKYLAPNTTYRVSFYYTGGVSDASGSIRMYKSSAPTRVIQIGKASSSNTWVSSTFTTPSDISLYDKIWAYGAGEMTYIQIEKDIGSRTDYEGHKSNIINFPYTLRSLPDGTKDYIEIDNINKTTKLYTNIGESVVNGSEGWILQSGTNPNTNGIISFFRSVTGSLPSTTTLQSISNYLIRDAVGSASVNREGHFVQGGTGGTSIYLRFTSSRFPDIATFKTWLAQRNSAGDPVKVQYKLATSTVTDLTYQELQVEYPVTNIYTNSIVKPKIIGQVVNK